MNEQTIPLLRRIHESLVLENVTLQTGNLTIQHHLSSLAKTKGRSSGIASTKRLAILEISALSNNGTACVKALLRERQVLLQTVIRRSSGRSRGGGYDCVSVGRSI
jgi:hypothetical protein